MIIHNLCACLASLLRFYLTYDMLNKYAILHEYFDLERADLVHTCNSYLTSLDTLGQVWTFFLDSNL